MWASDTRPHAKPGTLLVNGKTNEVSVCGDALGFILGRERSESHTSHCQRTMLAAFLPTGVWWTGQGWLCYRVPSLPGLGFLIPNL